MSDATPAVAPGRRRRLTFQARLMITIITIVSIILIVISGVMSVVLANVLDNQLSDRVRSQSQSTIRSTASLIAQGESAPDILEDRSTPDQAVLIINAIDGTTSGAVSDAGSIRELTSDELAAIDVTLEANGSDGSLSTVEVPGVGSYRVQIFGSDSGISVIFGLSTHEVQSTVGSILTTIALATVGGLMLLSAAVTVVVRAGLRPLTVVAETATRVSQQRLDQGDVAITERVHLDLADPRTEIGQVGAALNSLLDHVETSLDARQRNEEMMRSFVADASHELRTPLASIRGYSELSLRDPSLSQTSEQALERIQAQSIRMTSLVEDLLLLARLDEGREVITGTVDLTQVCVEAVADQRAVSQDHRWSVDVPELPVIVHGDQGRLTQVVVNLLANARTHTPPGTQITVDLALEGTGSATRAVLIVHDTGPGIDADFQQKLFQRFARSDSSRARKTGGTGLGLSIAKAIIDAHHGTISVRSVPSDTAFEIRLPARPV